MDTKKYKHDKQNDVCANTEMKKELTTVSLPYIRGTSWDYCTDIETFQYPNSSQTD